MTVSGLGGNVFGGNRLDRGQSVEVLHAAIDRGVNFVDTANTYNDGQSEEFIGHALRGRRDDLVVATKFNFRQSPAGTVQESIETQLSASLKRLDTDHVDLYQLHGLWGVTEVEPVLEALTRLQQRGLIRSFGACNLSAWRAISWNSVANASGSEGLVSMQNYYHLLARGAEAELLPMAVETEMAFLPYHPLGGGFLTGKYRAGQPAPAGTRGAAGSPIIHTMDTAANHEALRGLTGVADRCGRTLAELALAWVATQSGVTSVIAGVSSVEQLELNIAGASWRLDPEVVAELDQITAPGGVPASEELPYRP